MCSYLAMQPSKDGVTCLVNGHRCFLTAFFLCLCVYHYRIQKQLLASIDGRNCGLGMGLKHWKSKKQFLPCNNLSISFISVYTVQSYYLQGTFVCTVHWWEGYVYKLNLLCWVLRLWNGHYLIRSWLTILQWGIASDFLVSSQWTGTVPTLILGDIIKDLKVFDVIQLHFHTLSTSAKLSQFLSKP